MPNTLVRRARPADVDAMVALVHELAAYEREPGSCTLTAPQLAAALFVPDAALFAHVGEVDGDIVAVAIWFLTYSTWTGTHGVWLEDLFVSPAHRRVGLGRGLLGELARECTTRGYARLEWSVLDWNTPALEFYASLDALAMDEWTTQRVTGPALTALAAAPPPPPAR